MTREQAAAALGIPLAGREFFDKVVATIACASVPEYRAGPFSGTLQACFDDGAPGLSSIALGLDPAAHPFVAVIAELTASYGEPATHTRERFAAVVHDDATWLFPGTEIEASRTEVHGPSGPRVFLTITYRRSAAAGQ
jgi:hypothetical protein